MTAAVFVGSANPAKVSAVRAVVADLPGFGEVEGLRVASGVAAQPVGLPEIFEGAEHRARAAWSLSEGGPRFGVGLEDGLYENPVRDGRYLNVCVACAFDGAAVSFGTSPAFPVPVEVTQRIFRDGLDLSEALNAEGLVDDPAVGADAGAIGVLSAGRLVRAEYTRPAVLTALLPWLEA